MMKALILCGVVAFLSSGNPSSSASPPDSTASGTLPGKIDRNSRNQEQKMQDKDDLGRAMEAEAKSVELLYSIKPRRVLLEKREYRVPSNYLGPKERDEPETLRVGKDGFGFNLFLPNFVGYTKNNWKDPFDRQLIYVVQVKEIDKQRLVRQRDGTFLPIHPSSYGDAAAQFEAMRPLYEERPSLKLHSLDGYRGKGAAREVAWIGRRSNGEFFFLECSLAPDLLGQPGVYPSNPSCKTQYYSVQDELRIAYRFHQANFARWREIDDAIWAKLRSWQVTDVKGR